MGNQPSSNNSSPTKKNKDKNYWNPISQILSNKTIDSLKNKWNRQQLLIFQERIKSKKRDGWKLEELILLFPRLKRKGQHKSGFSEETLQRIYELFHRSKLTQNLTNSELLEGVTLIKMSESNQLISRLIFYLYCDNNRKEMNNTSYLKFLKENKSRMRNIDLLGELESWWPPKKTITPEQFEEIVAEYDKEKFKNLFVPDFILQEAKLVETLKLMKYLSREVGSQVYLIEYQWYLQWKDYMKMKYNIDPKIKEQKLLVNKEKQLEKSRFSFMSEKKLQYEYEFEKEIKRPGVIPNSKLVGDELEELRPNMKEFRDYVMIPAWLWSSLQIIFQGHPQIQRLYPQVYCLKVYQVFVDNEGIFVDNHTQHVQLCYNEMKIREILNTDGLKDTICMHKYPGLENWEETYNFDDSISKWNVYNCKIFICFVPKKLRDKFLMRYNVIINENGQKFVQERLKNYATLLYANINGVLRQGFVIKISADSVYLQYRNEENSRYEKKIKLTILRGMNNNTYFDNQSRNILAGLSNDNAGKSYLHALIQAIIRTPYFGKYLQSVPDLVKNQAKKETMIIWALSRIYQESRSRKGVINVTKFTNLIEKKLPLKQKFFLRKLLFILEKQFKLKHDEVEKASMEQQSNQGERNIIIEQFFQTEGIQITECDKCCYKEETSHDLYTHTLEFPEFQEIQIFFYYFPNNKSNNKWLPIKYGVTVSYDSKKELFMKKAAVLLGKQKQKLVFYAQADGEWKFNLKQDELHEKITQYHELGMRILCYQIQSSKNLFFQLRNRRSKVGSRYLHPFSVPILLQIASEDEWVDVVREIAVIYDSKYGQVKMKSYSSNRSSRSSINMRRSLRSINTRALERAERGQDSDDDDLSSNLINSRMEALDESHVMRSSIRKSHMSIDEMGKDALYTNQWYTIRVFKRDYPQHCFKCGRRFIKNSGLSAQCKGYCFRDKFRPSQDSRMMKHYKNVIITIDWLKYHCFDGFDHDNDQSALDLAKLSEEKKLQISQMLNNNPNFKEHVDCPNCDNQALRQISIKSYPNILIIELKRFIRTPQGMIKKQHRVYYDETLYHDGQKYHLFAVLVHVGTPAKGKFYSILKCDSYEEWFKCDEERVVDITKNQSLLDSKKIHISEDAYVLFYRKADIDPALMFYNPLI